MYVRLLMNEIFGEDNFRNEIVINRFQKASKGFTNTTESLFFYSATENPKINPLKRPRLCIYCKQPVQLRWTWAHSAGESKEPRYFVVDGQRTLLYPPKGRHWTNTQEEIDKLQAEGRIRINKNASYIDIHGNRINFVPEKLQSEEVNIDNNWTDIPGYEFGVFSPWKFPTENSEILLKRVIESASDEGDLVMDFFLGSGTTTAVAHKLKRKWIGIEMGEHFWTVVLPRMKKVLAYDKSGISKEKDVKEKYNEKSAGGFFKYQILEQYEDSLDNIELKENETIQRLFGDEYLIKYFLNYETKDSPYLLNIDLLKNPFAYKLKVNLTEVGEPKEIIIDIPETFNYILGLKVKKIKTRRNNNRKYLFILGEKEGKNIAVVWREYDDNWNSEDFKEDREFIVKELEPWMPHVVYVNGQSILTPNFGSFTSEIRYIEPEFKRLMEV
jgi:adenine-specific DNA-methyltransferase